MPLFRLLFLSVVSSNLSFPFFFTLDGWLDDYIELNFQFSRTIMRVQVSVP